MSNQTRAAEDRYTELNDTYGARVRVQESSAVSVEEEDGTVTGPYIWVFVEGGAVKNNDGAAHLNEDQARVIYEALGRWLDG